MAEQMKCPVCDRAAKVQEREFTYYVDCEVCGRYVASVPTIDDLRRLIEDSKKARALLSHYLRSRAPEGGRANLEYDQAENFLRSGSFPNPAEQAEALINWLGENQRSHHEIATIFPEAIAAIIGADGNPGTHFIVNQLHDDGLLRIDAFGNERGGELIGGIGLTFNGWQKFEEIRRNPSHGNTAFMAMAFGNDTLAQIVETHLKPAVSDAGFDLRRVDDNREADLIDNKIRNDIRAASFLVADLTDRNNGAYWEAGFAEGLGRKVFYTCEESAFRSGQVHFDANHQTLINWSSDDPDSFADNLKQSIRATLPELAIMEDG